MEKIAHLIQEMKGIVGELQETGCEIPAVARSAKRILASIKVLEINISGAWEMLT
jgi:hypothetical protein